MKYAYFIVHVYLEILKILLLKKKKSSSQLEIVL